MTTPEIQAAVDQLKRIQEDLEAAVKTTPQGSQRREALAMATGWMVYVRRDLEQAMSYES